MEYAHTALPSPDERLSCDTNLVLNSYLGRLKWATFRMQRGGGPVVV